MFISLRERDRALFLMLLGVFACSKEGAGDRSTATVSSIAPDSAGTAADSGPPAGAAPDSVTPARPQPAATTAAGAPADSLTQRDTTTRAAPPGGRRALPKPSIDPARVTPRSTGDSASSASRPAAAASATPTSSAATAQSQGLKYDAASNTVTFDLTAGPFTWNGFSSGGGTLLLPPKANVVMNFVNKDGTPHSAEVISGEGSVPNAAVDPAIPRAYTNKVLEGLPQEGSDVMRFTVGESGSYRIFCGVPGHGLSGMWIWMKVDPAAKAPSFGATKG
jgi:hypothetical protein